MKKTKQQILAERIASVALKKTQWTREFEKERDEKHEMEGAPFQYAKNKLIEKILPMHYEQSIDYHTQRSLKKTAEITAGKATPRPAVRIPQGMRGQDMGDLRMSNAQRTNIGISTEKVRELHEEGRKPGDIAKLLRTTPQTVSYHLKKLKK